MLYNACIVYLYIVNHFDNHTMKILTTYSILLFCCLSQIIAQTCTSNRYIDNIFSVTKINNLEYGEAPDHDGFEWFTPDETLELDIYHPTGDTISKRPAIIMHVGGAFLAALEEHERIVYFCEQMAAKGFVTISANYRVGFSPFQDCSPPRAVYRGAQDMKATIRYIKANADTYNIDTSKIIVGGASAGGSNALLANFGTEYERATHPLGACTYAIDNSFPEPNWPDLGCVECSGNNLGQSPYNYTGVGHLVLNLWGFIYDTLLIEPGVDVLPVISFHGLDDDTVSPYTAAPYQADGLFPAVHGSVPLHNYLNSIGNINEVHLYPGEGHELWQDTPLADDIIAKSSAFIYTHLLRPPTPTIVGSNEACLNSMATYSVSPQNNMQYCWTINGNGTIINDYGNSIEVLWNNSTGIGTVSMQYVTPNWAESDLATIDVSLTPCTSVYANVLLEGAYTSNNNMHTMLNDNALIPLTQPYAVAPYNYAGNESIDNLPSTAVDWVLVELRESTAINTVVASKAALVYNDGNLYDIDGSLGVKFANIFQTGNYHLLIRHRNHVDVMSRVAVTLPNALNPYLFSVDAAVWGENQMVNMGGGVYALKAGDMDANGVINVQDFSTYIGQAAQSLVYQSGDISLDGAVGISDFSPYYNNVGSIGISAVRY